MTREEAYSILHNGLLNAPSEHDWCMAFDMVIKALEETGIKPPCGVKELLAERKKTNQQMLATISAEEFYDKIMWLLHEYGKRYTDSRLAIIEWLQTESEEKR